MFVSLRWDRKQGVTHRQQRLIWGVVLLLVTMVLLSMRHYDIPVAVNDRRSGEQMLGESKLPETMLVDVMDHISRDENLKVHASRSTVGRGLVLGDLFIAIKTTKKFHQSRMRLLLLTWISRVKEQTYVFTDEEDDELQGALGDHVVFTNCSAEHNHPALSCKMAVEFDAFLASELSWFCHLDDDNYLNPQALLKLLASYSPDQDVYIGKPSLNRPIHASETLPNNQTFMANAPWTYLMRFLPLLQKSVYFWFATGGAGFCISQKLANKMAPWASGSNFLSTSELIRLPDDCTVGYIVECKLGGHLVASDLFHSHLENLQLMQADQLASQVTLSYGIFEKKLNAIKLAGPFSQHDDPSRFRSLHCILYPDTSWCP